jgi:hypothetical protein
LARKVSVVQNQMTSSRSPNWNSLEHGVIEGPYFENGEWHSKFELRPTWEET